MFGRSPQYEGECLEIARLAFEEVVSRFPNLKAEAKFESPDLWQVVFPVQEGVNHEVCLYHQNIDELSFGVDEFWTSWFPCSDRDNVEKFLKAVTMYLAGTAMVREHFRGNKMIKAELLAYIEGQWKSLAGSYALHFPFPIEITYRDLWNRPR